MIVEKEGIGKWTSRVQGDNEERVVFGRCHLPSLMELLWLMARLASW